ncbi:coiled-coil domain-containing protein 40 [Plakobranchus ocellatus]|uniref:Coiled-coil domain-containing protein 40 n=1 Tax=Plakobranchus ocellatus TaxID=259542 RepID=A0AAV4BA39_9GAST|nr:coiled-coil domain-containing protein 40 [Plakobranchus ocellatus]
MADEENQPTVQSEGEAEGPQEGVEEPQGGVEEPQEGDTEGNQEEVAGEQEGDPGEEVEEAQEGQGEGAGETQEGEGGEPEAAADIAPQAMADQNKEGKHASPKGSRPPSGKGPSPVGSQPGSRPISRTASQTSPHQLSQPTSQQGLRLKSNIGSAHGSQSMSAMNVAAEGDDDANQGLPEFYPESYGLAGRPPNSNGGGGDDDDGDDDFDDDDEEMAGGDDGMESEGSEDETDMVVLDPEHPLMKRFQAALGAHLNKQNEKISLELRDLDETLRVKRKEREDLGVELYGVQQELARYQMLLEQKHDQVAELKQERQKEEQELSDVRGLYKDSQTLVTKERKKGSELQSEVENLALRLFYMENAKEDVRSDISVMRRAAEKVESEVSKAESEKQRQDLYVDRLVEKVDKLKEEIAMYEAQISAQSEETKAAKESLMEAYMEIEAISLEKKDLYQKWSSSLIGMRRRDEAHAAMQEALNEQEQHILSLATEIEGYKKSIMKEQEQNEKLTLILGKTEREIEIAKKSITQIQAKHDALKAEYTTYTRMLNETEQALARALADQQLRTNEMTSLRKQIEQEYLAKVKLEDEIMERMRTQLTLDKAAQYSKKLTGKVRDTTKHLETDIAELENNIASSTLECVNIRARTDRLNSVFAELDNQIAEHNKIITKSEQEIIKRNAIIERKQNQVDVMNKKLNQMIANAGGVELGPLEIQVNSIQKSIEAMHQEVMELQQLWLRQQNELVRLSQTKEKDLQDLVACKRQLTILSQKKIRTENEIDQQHREMCDIERNVRNMRNDIIKINTLLHKEKNVGEQLEQGNILMENAFVAGLKDAEMESIQLQAKLDDIKDEKERLLNSLVEAERQIMLWEKKTQLARETRAAVDSEVGQGEMRAMRSEIHRMQVRHSQLMKQQEKMIQDMEKAVSRRDTILTRGDAMSKMKKKVVTKGTFERQMAELRKKIKQTIHEANACDGEIRELQEHQQGLSEQLEEKQVNCQQLQSASDSLDGDVERTLEVKQKNLQELLAKQQKMKYYQQAKEGKYTMLCKTPAALELEMNKQGDRMQALSAIVDRLNSEFPHAQQALRKATMTLASRTAGSDDA